MSVQAGVAVVGRTPTAQWLAELAESAGHTVERLGAGEPAAAEFVFVATDADGAEAPGLSEVVRAAAGAATAGTVVVPCTTLLSPTELARQTDDPACVVGLHMFASAPGTGLAEVVPAEQSAPGNVERLSDLLKAFGLAVIVVKDRPGFLIQRLFLPYLNQAVQALDDGVASAADIDASVELGLGYPVGPLRLLDDLGLARHAAVTAALCADLADPHFAPPPLLSRRATMGSDGRLSPIAAYAGRRHE
jgi:3-hydroxybutyryl-CoA dehydrogenase